MGETVRANEDGLFIRMRSPFRATGSPRHPFSDRLLSTDNRNPSPSGYSNPTPSADPNEVLGTLLPVNPLTVQLAGCSGIIVIWIGDKTILKAVVFLAISSNCCSIHLCDGHLVFISTITTLSLLRSRQIYSQGSKHHGHYAHSC